MPMTLNDYIGQDKIRQQLRIWLDSSLHDRKPLPHILLTSDPGMGKTTLARIIATEMGERETLDLDLSRMTAKRLIDIFVRFNGGIILCDEVHRSSKDQQNLLLEALYEGRVTLTHGTQMELPLNTFIFATTHEEKLEPAFMDRCPIRLELAPYSEQDMPGVIAQMAREASVEVSLVDIPSLARATLGNPRDAHDLVLAYNALKPTATAAKALALMNKQPDGLNDRHIRYMEALKVMGGTKGRLELSKFSRLHPLVMDEVENVLIKRGFLLLTDQGRMLTPMALRRLREVENA
jgi:holliday junction DNA helicase RuvB